MGGALPERSTPDAEVVTALRAAGCVFAEEEASLLEAAAGAGNDLAAMVARRVAGEPLEQVLGWVEFSGLRIVVSPGVFVPRRRTELVVDLAAEIAGRLDHPARVLDLCCGTGAIGAALAARLSGIVLHACDVDPAAVACARLNLASAQVHQGDLYDALPDDLRGAIDLLLVNAPYVPTDAIRLMPPEARLHEPRVALDGGVDGLDLHRRVAARAGDWLAPGGSLLLETSRQQAEHTEEVCRAGGLQPRLVVRGESTVVHAISGLRPSSGTMTG